MKPRRAPAKKKSGGGTLLGLFIGLVIGVLVAAGVVWYINKMPTPFTTKAPLPSAPPVAAGNKAPQPTEPGAAPLPLPGKPGDPVPAAGDKPRFDFYKILPGNAEAIPDPKPADSPKAKSKAEKEEPTLKEPLYLQVGSFQTPGDADNQKAKLALLGSEASVQQVMVQDKVWYRVRLGPFDKLDEVNRLRVDLAKQGIDANIVRKD
jgi:cell division protein FtsN